MFLRWLLRLRLQNGDWKKEIILNTIKKNISHSISPIILMSPSCYYIIQFLYHLFDKLKWGILTWRTKETKITPTFKIDPTSELASKGKQKSKKKKIRSNKICIPTIFFLLSIFLLLSLIFFSCNIGGKILFLIWQDIQFIKTFIFSEITTKYHGNYRNKAISF